jgi:predicted aspartyl protease
MIRGYLVSRLGQPRPYVTARVTVPSQSVMGDVAFLVDTGADSTVLAPAGAAALGLDVGRLQLGPSSRGIGGVTRTALAPATVTLGSYTLEVQLRVLAPATAAQRNALQQIPSLLGRDLIRHFALSFEQGTRRVLLLDPAEAATLPLP